MAASLEYLKYVVMSDTQTVPIICVQGVKEGIQNNDREMEGSQMLKHNIAVFIKELRSLNVESLVQLV